jgi:hypothetical protein
MNSTAPITRIVATALLALTIGCSASAQANERDVSRTGLGDMALTREDVPRVFRTGLGDMRLTLVHGGASTRAPQPVATQTPDRTSWPLIIVSVLLAATLTGHYYRARRRRSRVAR